MKKSKVCKVSGGNLPDGYEAKIDVTIDYSDVSEEVILDWATSHVIINVQRVLRGKSTTELNQLAKDGYEVKASAAGRTTVDPVTAYKAKFSGMTKEEKLAQIAELEAIAELED